ncbi:MAG: ABC transporter ATP-binding protein [Bacteroidetes bacterium]|nr:ABC transporter ATP-binding protein [Bacteroidota bacterium]MBS1929700.1 ABC transporter ATP-binding protein [Bacteroidota bacterium]
MLPLLSINNLSVDFMSEDEIIVALKNISFDVHRGEIVALVGESGSGKSVTSLSILKLLSPSAKFSSGKIVFSENEYDAEDLLQKSSRELQQIRGNKITMIFQEPMTSLNPVITCGKQITESIQQHQKISYHKAKEKTIEWFQKVKLPYPSNIFNRYPHQLSGGQKQRVMIAMAMCCHPSLLICDEPTTALDVTVQKTILQLIKELQQQSDMGVIFITHDLSLVAEIADRAIVMYRGEIAEQGSVKEIFTNAKHPYTKALLACRPANHKKQERLPVVSDFLNIISGLKILQPEPGPVNEEKKKSDQTTPLLRVENLSVWFPTKKTFLGKPIGFTKAVDNVSFEVFKGETLGLVGESGCGKTTLGRTLLRLIEPTSGKIIYNNTELTLKKKEELTSLRKDIQIVFQDPYSSLNPRLSIGYAIAEPLKVHGLISKQKERKEKVFELLEKVGLKADHFSRYPHEFSGGQRQRIVIARALALSPSFLVCDESVSALDVSVQAQVLNLLNDLKKEYGFTIIFISHDLSVVHYISDRIMVMNKGKVEETGVSENVFFHPQSEYTRKLIDSIPKGIVA